jgi:hypothetical protein
VDNFKIYVNGQLISSTISNFHIVSGKLVTPLVTAVGYSIANAGKLIISRISWNYGQYALNLLTESGIQTPNYPVVEQAL